MLGNSSVLSGRNGTQAVPYVFADRSVFSTNASKKPLFFRKSRLKGETFQRYCRERPMCRSGGVAKTTHVDKTEPSPDMSFRANAVSRGIFPSCRFYLVLVPLPTWWIPPLRFAPVGMTYGGTFSGIIGNSSVLSGAERHTGRSLRFR